ncbi:hypothetical protein LCGC14_2618410, partial [marine sediment metagenome]
MLVAMAVLGGAAWATWRLLSDPHSSAAQTVRDRGRAVLYECEACGAVGETRIPFAQSFPIACPDCGEVKAMTAFRCADCRKIIKAEQKQYYKCRH